MTWQGNGHCGVLLTDRIIEKNHWVFLSISCLHGTRCPRTFAVRAEEYGKADSNDGYPQELPQAVCLLDPPFIEGRREKIAADERMAL